MTGTDTVTEFVTDAIKADAQMDEWDLPPKVWLAFEDHAEGVPYIVDLRVPGEFFAIAGKSWQGLLVLAGAMKQGMVPPFPALALTGDHLLALIVRDEGWALRGTAEDGAGEEAKAYVENGGSIRDHPDRAEVKMYSAWIREDDNINLLTGWQFRGEQPEVEARSNVEGNVDDSARVFIESFLELVGGR